MYTSLRMDLIGNYCSDDTVIKVCIQHFYSTRTSISIYLPHVQNVFEYFI